MPSLRVDGVELRASLAVLALASTPGAEVPLAEILERDEGWSRLVERDLAFVDGGVPLLNELLAGCVVGFSSYPLCISVEGEELSCCMYLDGDVAIVHEAVGDNRFAVLPAAAAAQLLRVLFADATSTLAMSVLWREDGGTLSVGASVVRNSDEVLLDADPGSGQWKPTDVPGAWNAIVDAVWARSPDHGD